MSDTIANHDSKYVYVCYSPEDLAIANAIVSGLEAKDIRCWYAPRDCLNHDATSASGIVTAIRKASLILFIYTEHSNTSSNVAKEISLAADYGIDILPLILTHEPMNNFLAFHLSCIRWIYATSSECFDAGDRIATCVSQVSMIADRILISEVNRRDAEARDRMLSERGPYEEQERRRAEEVKHITECECAPCAAPKCSPSERRIPTILEIPLVVAAAPIVAGATIIERVKEAREKSRNRRNTTHADFVKKAADTQASPAITSPAKQTPAITQVRFVTIATLSLNRGSYAQVDVVMHEHKYESVVQQIVEERKNSANVIDGGCNAARIGTRVRVVLSSPELGDIGTQETEWHGKYIRFPFVFMIPSDLNRPQISFTADVFFDDVPATKLSFVASCSKEGPQKMEASRSDIQRAFVSYASEDRPHVTNVVQGIHVARPDLDVFFDVMSLRTGQDWRQTLKEEIDGSDVLYLCWSRSASESKWVDFEWRCAFERLGPSGIEPVAIEPPELCPPPPELRDKHFNDPLVYIVCASTN